MFTSIVVPLDLEAGGDRALPLARALAVKASIPLELVTISSPGIPEVGDNLELQKRVLATTATCTTTVLHDNDVAGAIVSFLANRPDALVVMATHARGVFGDFVLGSVTESVLARVDQPLLLVGPATRIANRPKNPSLVVGVDGTNAADALVPALTRWTHTFRAPPLVLVEVLPVPRDVRDLPDILESCHLDRLATRLKEKGVDSKWEIAYGKHVATELAAIADGSRDAVLVVASVRWTDPEHPHLASLARRLTQRAHQPVLVVRAAAVSPS